MLNRSSFLHVIFLLISFSATAWTETASTFINDTIEVQRLLQLSKDNFSEAPEKVINFAEKALQIADSLQYREGVAVALKNIGIGYYFQSENLEALQYWQRSLQIYKALNDEIGVANILNNIGAIYFNQGDDAKALEYYLQSLTLAEKTNDKLRILSALNNIGGVYDNKDATKDKALTYFLKALPLSEELDDKEAIGTTAVNIGEIYYDINNDSLALVYYKISEKAYNGPYVYNAIGKVYQRQLRSNLAISYHKRALAIAEKLNSSQDVVQSLYGLGAAHILKNEISLGLSYLKSAEKLANQYGFNKELKDLYQALAKSYSDIMDYKSAYDYQKLFSNIKDSLYNIETDKKLVSLQFDYELLKKQGEINLLTKDRELQEAAITRQRWTILAILVGTLLILFIAFNLSQTLKKLKSTQAKLIQSEKMASLGAFTAGIAHEIQNPLNFVNNFSELSSELIVEMNEELEKGDVEEAKIIALDIQSNLDKINQHGTRASEIIKGMLQHSRARTGQSEQTDINELCNEFLKLSYHGQRAKDKSFNAVFETDFDANLSKIEIIPQDISRVILNIINNAFYAVNEKSKTGIMGYGPKVKVSTSKVGDKIVIKVADNGTGMPKHIKDKIFQPFFTTKPTGQGTGLGLSLSFDIIKAHGGTLSVDTVHNEGTVFSVSLPMNRHGLIKR
jgi:signal transduction histidine kinase